MTATVVVVGGGYGGSTVAQALDDAAHVILIDPKDCFVHNVAALRTIVDPSWADKIFLPYDNLLKHGTVVHDRVVHVDDKGVDTASGHRIDADYIVLASGTSYPFPAKINNLHASAGKMRIEQTSEALGRADRVLLMGAGAVGLELAGEIVATYPNKRVTILDPAPVILSSSFIAGFDPELKRQMRIQLREQLDELGIELVLGTAPRAVLPTRACELGTFTAETAAGPSITADMWFRCHGRQPVSRYLDGPARTRNDRVAVTPELRVVGTRRTFAIGDIAVTGAPDTAVIAIETAEVAARNIKTLISGEGELDAYEPAQPIFLVPLGPKAGVTYMPGEGLMGPDSTAEMKGNDLLVEKYAEIFGIDAE